MNLADIPKTSGTYVVLVRLDQAHTLKIGKLGEFTCDEGVYAYIGSAHGPGGLYARLSRHLRAEKKLHWHIDYLTAVAPISTIWWSASPERVECAWASRLIRVSGVRVPIPGFGSSDCRCESHLLALAPESIPVAYETLNQFTTGLHHTSQ